MENKVRIRRDERLYAIYRAVYEDLPSTPGPESWVPERHLRAAYTMMALERVYCGKPVDPDEEELLLRPIEEIRVDIADLVGIGSGQDADESSSGYEVADVDDDAWIEERDAWIADLERRHASWRAILNRKLLDVFRGYDPSEYSPEIASGIAAAIPDLERMIALDDRLAMQPEPIPTGSSSPARLVSIS
jgi:hypothetical protein